MIDPYAAMQPRALKLTAKELLTLNFVQDKAEARDDFLDRVLNEVAELHSVHGPQRKAMAEFEAELEAGPLHIVECPAYGGTGEPMSDEQRQALEAEYFAAACA